MSCGNIGVLVGPGGHAVDADLVRTVVNVSPGHVDDGLGDIIGHHPVVTTHPETVEMLTMAPCRWSSMVGRPP